MKSFFEGEVFETENFAHFNPKTEWTTFYCENQVIKIQDFTHYGLQIEMKILFTYFLPRFIAFGGITLFALVNTPLKTGTSSTKSKQRVF